MPASLRAEDDVSFPIACETCLGDSANIRIIRSEYEKECKVCQRPCVCFRWQPGTHARYKISIICQTCAKLQNVCQVCLFDLKSGLPVQVRNALQPTAASDANEVAKTLANKTGMNRDYAMMKLQNQASSLELSQSTTADALSNHASTSQPSGQGFDQPASKLLAQIARKGPYYKRNEARVCSFWLKGACNRGERCPFKHEKDDREHSNTNSVKRMRDRYFGVNDEFADKLLASLKDKQNNEEGDRDLAAPPPPTKRPPPPPTKRQPTDHQATIKPPNNTG